MSGFLGSSGPSMAYGTFDDEGILSPGSVGVESVSKDSEGVYTVTFFEGIFSTFPVSVLATSASGIAVCSVDVNSATEIVIACRGGTVSVEGTTFFLGSFIDSGVGFLAIGS